jgi:hypothetical protein
VQVAVLAHLLPWLNQHKAQRRLKPNRSTLAVCLAP